MGLEIPFLDDKIENKILFEMMTKFGLTLEMNNIVKLGKWLSWPLCTQIYSINE
jgi:hypothetical protein